MVNVKLVYGVGKFSHGGGHSSRIAGIKTREYELWTGILQRSYSSKFHIRNPTYVGCSVSENFKGFDFFASWCNRQTGFQYVDWELDKDILVKGNKLYSEDNCVFIPREINLFLNKMKKKRGRFPIGVYYDTCSGKFKAQMRTGTGSMKNLGRFTTPEEAFTKYKMAKEGAASALAKKYDGIVDSRVTEALRHFTVEITD